MLETFVKLTKLIRLLATGQLHENVGKPQKLVSGAYD